MKTESMEWRIDYQKIAPEAIKTLSAEQYRLARQHFDQRGPVDLTMAIIAINSWTRLAISFRMLAGTYQQAKERAAG
jgi:hypothetical protein